MIDQSKAYKTRDGREVRIYATDGKGPWPVHGAIKDGNRWSIVTWRDTGKQNVGSDSYSDLIPADPLGILPRHRELLASAMEGLSYYTDATVVREAQLNDLVPSAQAALIALARQTKCI